MTEPTDTDLTATYERCSYGGPNPFYRCKQCGDEVPGVRNELVDHYKMCVGNTEELE